MVVKGSDSRKRVSLVRGNVAQSIVDQGRGVCVLSAEVQEAGRLGLRSAARQPSVGEVVRFEDVSPDEYRARLGRGESSPAGSSLGARDFPPVPFPEVS